MFFFPKCLLKCHSVTLLAVSHSWSICSSLSRPRHSPHFLSHSRSFSLSFSLSFQPVSPRRAYLAVAKNRRCHGHPRHFKKLKPHQAAGRRASNRAHGTSELAPSRDIAIDRWRRLASSFHLPLHLLFPAIRSSFFFDCAPSVRKK